MIGEAVSAFRGDVAEGQTELRLELPVDARIPEDYIESERLRLEAYQKLSTASAPASPDDTLDRVIEELADRYGELPDAVQQLVAVSRLRRRAQKAGLGEVVAMGGRMRLAPLDPPDSIQVRLTRMYPGVKFFAAQHAVNVPMPEGASDAELIEWVGQLLTAATS
jgi:transcription-repair coupling factor (superfamily II helicase)